MSANTSSAYIVAQLIEKMNNPDNDFRFMAINDLMKELRNETFKLDDDAEWKVTRALVKLLDDPNGEVQNLAVKCLGMIAKVINQTQADWLLEKLFDLINSSKEEQEDIGCISLKTVIGNLVPNSTTSTNIVRKCVPNIRTAIDAKKRSMSSHVDLLEILGDILQRFGSSICELHPDIQSTLLQQLSVERPAIRKKAIAALGLLEAVASNDLFKQTVDVVLDRLATVKSPSAIRTYILSLNSIARSSANRFSNHLSKVLPHLIQFLRTAKDDELRESALQCIETFLYRCPKEVNAFQTDVHNVLSDNLCYDPNYSYEGDDEEDEAMEVENEEDGEADEDDYSDDDDMSYKVRRAAAKAIEAMIVCRHDQLTTSVATYGPLLISRFKEREENVRIDIISAYISLLKEIHHAVPNAVKSLADESDMETEMIGSARLSTVQLQPDQLNLLRLLSEQLEPLLKAVIKQMKHKSIRSRQKAFELSTQLVRVLPDSLSTSMDQFIPRVVASLNDKSCSAQMKIDTLAFLTQTLISHNPNMFVPHLDVIVSVLVSSVKDNFYKLASEGLQLARYLLDVMAETKSDKQVPTVFDAIYEKLLVADTDQEVKERAIDVSGHCLALFPQPLASRLQQTFGILLERLRNEMTRLVAIRSFNEIVAKQTVPPEHIINILPQLLPFVADFLKKNQRALKIASLNFLRSLMAWPALSNALNSKEMELIITEFPQLIKDADLTITQSVLKCASACVTMFPQQFASHLSPILESFTILSQSPLLQGSTLTSALDFVRAIVHSNLPNKPSFEQLLETLCSPIYSTSASNAALPKQAFHSISAELATVAATSESLSEAQHLASQLAKQLSSSDSSETVRLFAIYALGELGRRYPKVYDQDDTIKPASLMVQVFNSQSEEMKTAAAQSLGALAVGNIKKFLPFILEQINTQEKRQYLLLHALKEVIAWDSTENISIDVLKAQSDGIWKVLMAHATREEEGTRNVVAECLGRLCVIHPSALFPLIKQHIRSDSAAVRCTVVTSVKFMISEEKTPFDAELQANIGDFLDLIKDDNLEVRRVVLALINSAAHNKPSLIRERLPVLLPSIYEETRTRKELIREVEMGPFKHQVDDGLDLRKAAFECMYTLLISCLEKIDVFEFISHMENGLRDGHHDVRLLTYLMLSKLVTLCPQQVLSRMDRIAEPLRTQMTSKVKTNAVKQEIEKNEEIKRAVIRVVLTIQRVPDADKCNQVSELLTLIRSECLHLLESVQRDAHRSYSTDTPMDI